MKNTVLIALLLVASYTAHCQTTSEASEKSAMYGFNIGLNYANAFTKDDLQTNSSIHNGVGFSLGVLADYTLTNALFFSPKAELAFFDSQLNESLPDGSETAYEIMPTALDIKAHFTVKKVGDRLSPYFLVGPSVKIPLNQPKVSTEFSTGYDIAIDFGIGLSKKYIWFNLAPELRYSFGLRNVNENPILRSMYFHNVSLVVNILG